MCLVQMLQDTLSVGENSFLRKYKCKSFGFERIGNDSAFVVNHVFRDPGT